MQRTVFSPWVVIVVGAHAKRGGPLDLGPFCMPATRLKTYNVQENIKRSIGHCFVGGYIDLTRKHRTQNDIQIDLGDAVFPYRFTGVSVVVTGVHAIYHTWPPIRGTSLWILHIEKWVIQCGGRGIRARSAKTLVFPSPTSRVVMFRIFLDNLRYTPPTPLRQLISYSPEISNVNRFICN